MDAMSLVVPDDVDLVRQMPSSVLYQLEEAGRIATEVLDARVVDWTERGWTQRQIAEELGCDRSTVGYRQRRLGVEPTSNRGRPKVELGSVPNSPDEPEIVDAEVVEDAPSPPATADAVERVDVGSKYKTADVFIRKFREQVANINPRVGGQINTAPEEIKLAWHADVSYVIQQLKQLERALRP